MSTGYWVSGTGDAVSSSKTSTNSYANPPGPSWSAVASNAISGLFAGYLTKKGTTTSVSQSDFDTWLQTNPLDSLYSNPAFPVDPYLKISAHQYTELEPAGEKYAFPFVSLSLDDVTTSDTNMNIFTIPNPQSTSNMATSYGPQGTAMAPTTSLSIGSSNNINVPHANYNPSWKSARQTVFQQPSGSNTCTETIVSSNNSDITYTAPPTDQCICRCQVFPDSNQLNPVNPSDCISLCKGSSWSADGPQITDLWRVKTSNPTGKGTFSCVPVTESDYNGSNFPAMTENHCKTYAQILNGTTPNCVSGNCFKYDSTQGTCVKSEDTQCTDGTCGDICPCCKDNNVTTGACAKCSNGDSPGSNSYMYIGLVVIAVLVILYVRHLHKKKK